MRSRYTAFARGDAAYLLRTWDPKTRPRRLDLDDALRWTGLEVLATTGGALFDTEGTVRFAAHYTDRGRAGVLREHSRFVRSDGAWLYVGPIPAAR
jgi:SEC-C motif-containing protein